MKSIPKFLTCLALVLVSLCVNAQYYYKDIITTQQVSNNYHLMKKANVATVVLKSFIQNNEVTEGFDCNQKVSAAQDKVITYTKTTDAGESFFTAFYNKNDLLIETIDSSSHLVSTTDYSYDASNRLTGIKSSSQAANIVNVEVHTWQYNEKGNPVSMLRVRNGADTTWITYVLDDKGNPTEEHAKRNVAIPQPTVFYYYDDNHRLTDVVRYNQKAKRMLPDYMFEYDESNKISVMTVVPEGSNDYQKWYYKYDEDGLKAADFCYNKKNELQGKILYDYTYTK
ncbi:hypothetical protein [Pinibacter aurantiacus]|nr:hypothetical protein [Pinibacter aurantiacus]